MAEVQADKRRAEAKTKEYLSTLKNTQQTITVSPLGKPNQAESYVLRLRHTNPRAGPSVTIKKMARIKRRSKRPVLRCCAMFRFLDIIWRVLFPCIYVPFLVHALAQVNFGRDWEALISSAKARTGCDGVSLIEEVL